MKAKIAIIFILLSLIYPPAQAADAPIVTATLYSSTLAISPGKPFQIGVLLEPKPGWHTYWENPGDAGLATELSWKLPDGFAAGTIDWPTPTRIEEGPLAVYGYEKSVFLPVTITPPANLPATNYDIRVTANWLVCNNICIPETVDLSLTLPVGEDAPSADAQLFAEHDARKPLAINEILSYAVNDAKITLKVPKNSLKVHESSITGATFFPRESNAIRYAAEQKFSVEGDSVTLTLDRVEAAPPPTLSGLLALTVDGEEKLFDVAFKNTAASGVAQDTSVMPVASSELAQNGNFFVTLFLALLGGLILNLMPCVLPVLSLKALAIVKKSGGEKSAVRKQGIAYTLGIMVSFALLAGVLLALKNAGEAVGWGFQMQSPAFVGFLIYLLFLVGLSLSGFFHLPVLLGNVGGDIVSESSARGSFFTGVLAAAVATPCTAPFMAPAVGAALTLPAWQAMLIFESLAFGLALPFLLISFFPATLKFLPRPGAWMETFKKILALPMYASVLWLLWVLMQQAGMHGVVVAVVGMAALALAIGLKKRMAAWIIVAAVLAISLPVLSSLEAMGMKMPPASMSEGVDIVPYSKAKLDELRAAGKPVFIDATAAWCITCQVNAHVAIHTARTMQAFKEHGITLMIADWTRQNEEITQFLASFGYQGVPLYVFYPAKGEPKILPQLLTEETVMEALNP
jgi:thiol:disulfide interchange protein